MFIRILIYIIGIILASTGLTFIIIYLNLINMGYTFLEYVNFIIRRLECLNLFIGIILILISLLVKKKGIQNGIHIRHFS